MTRDHTEKTRDANPGVPWFETVRFGTASSPVHSIWALGSRPRGPATADSYSIFGGVGA
jgi:hypothetical protein